MRGAAHLGRLFFPLWLFLVMTPALCRAQEESGEDASVDVVLSLMMHGERTKVDLQFSKPPSNASFRHWKVVLERVLGVPLSRADHNDFDMIPGFRTQVAASGPLPGRLAGPWNGLQRDGEIDLPLLVAEMKRNGLHWVQVSTLSRPPLQSWLGPDKSPPPSGKNLPPGAIPESAAQVFPVDEEFSVPLRYHFSYKADQTRPALLLLLSVLLLPVLATVTMRSIALRKVAAEGIDDAVIWFGYGRFLQWLVAATWLLWFAAIILTRAPELLGFCIGGRAVFHYFGLAAWLAYLPVLPIILCCALSHPVYARVRDSELTHGDLVRQALWSQARFLPVVCYLAAIGNVGWSSRAVVLWFAAILFAFLLTARGTMRAMGLTTHALTVGELRDRVFQLAGEAGVRIQQVYFLTSNKNRMANAFAVSNNQVYLTDYLLQHLTRREVDAVIAHELTHLRKKHGMARQRLWIVVMIGLGWSAYQGTISGNSVMEAALYLTILAGGLFLSYFLSRRFEFQADAGAVALTGDPEACITGLSRLSRLNKMPMHWGKAAGNWITHPPTLRRVEAMARQGNVPPERLQEIIGLALAEEENPDLVAADRYPRPDDAHDALLFSTNFKTGALLRLSWTPLLLSAAIPAAVALVAEYLHLDGPLLWAAYAGGFALTWLLRREVNELLRMRTMRPIEEGLRKRLAKTGITGDATTDERIVREGLVATLYPGRYPRLHEGWWAWDAGLVSILGEDLTYAGERVAFKLSREQIVSIEPRWPHVSLGLPAAILIGWKGSGVQAIEQTVETDSADGTAREAGETGEAGEAGETGEARETGAAGDTIRYLGLLTSPALSRKRGLEQRDELLQRLREWQVHPSVSAHGSSASASLTEPRLGPVTNLYPRSVASFQNMAVSVLFAALVGTGVSVLCGWSLNGDRPGGFYVTASAILFSIISVLPYRFYQDSEE